MVKDQRAYLPTREIILSEFTRTIRNHLFFPYDFGTTQKKAFRVFKIGQQLFKVTVTELPPAKTGIESHRLCIARAASRINARVLDITFEEGAAGQPDMSHIPSRRKGPVKAYKQRRFRQVAGEMARELSAGKKSVTKRFKVDPEQFKAKLSVVPESAAKGRATRRLRVTRETRGYRYIPVFELMVEGENFNAFRTGKVLKGPHAREEMRLHDFIQEQKNEYMFFHPRKKTGTEKRVKTACPCGVN